MQSIQIAALSIEKKFHSKSGKSECRAKCHICPNHPSSAAFKAPRRISNPFKTRTLWDRSFSLRREITQVLNLYKNRPIYWINTRIKLYLIKWIFPGTLGQKRWNREIFLSQASRGCREIRRWRTMSSHPWKDLSAALLWAKIQHLVAVCRHETEMHKSSHFHLRIMQDIKMSTRLRMRTIYMECQIWLWHRRSEAR